MLGYLMSWAQRRPVDVQFRHLTVPRVADRVMRSSAPERRVFG
jgi:hypothetical protein